MSTTATSEIGIVQPQHFLIQGAVHMYDSVCQTADWLDKKWILFSEQLCKSEEIAAIARVAVKTLATLGLMLVSPLPGLINYAIVSLAQIAITKGDFERPRYATTACLAQLFIQSITLSHPILSLIARQGSLVSYALHALSALGTGWELFQNGIAQVEQELYSSFTLHQERPKIVLKATSFQDSVLAAQ